MITLNIYEGKKITHTSVLDSFYCYCSGIPTNCIGLMPTRVHQRTDADSFAWPNAKQLTRQLAKDLHRVLRILGGARSRVIATTRSD